jgi:hypothetical protein
LKFKLVPLVNIIPKQQRNGSVKIVIMENMDIRPVCLAKGLTHVWYAENHNVYSAILSHLGGRLEKRVLKPRVIPNVLWGVPVAF